MQTIGCGVVFVPLNWFGNGQLLAVLEVAMMVFAGVMYWLSFGRISTRTAVWLYLLPFLATLDVSLYIAPRDTVFVWALLIPLVSYRLVGARRHDRGRPLSCRRAAGLYPAQRLFRLAWQLAQLE